MCHSCTQLSLYLSRDAESVSSAVHVAQSMSLQTTYNAGAGTINIPRLKSTGQLQIADRCSN
jgi:hypothetical protein